jgi:hypothetical protein
VYVGGGIGHSPPVQGCSQSGAHVLPSVSMTNDIVTAGARRTSSLGSNSLVFEVLVILKILPSAHSETVSETVSVHGARPGNEGLEATHSVKNREAELPPWSVNVATS